MRSKMLLRKLFIGRVSEPPHNALGQDLRRYTDAGTCEILILADLLLHLGIMEALITLQDKEINSGDITVLAMQLEACMLADETAQARYLAIYGEPWVSLLDCQEARERTARSNLSTQF